VKRLVIATTNEGKVIEVRSALGAVPGWFLDVLPPGIPSIEETQDTFLGNAVQKAEHYSRFIDDLTLADDSGLCVRALGGRPGVHSARYAENPPARIKRLLHEMQSIPDAERDAVFYCALAAARGGKIIWTVTCDVQGVIAKKPSGTEGFGYDPVFLLPERKRTMAQLNTEEKNRLSARGKALAELHKFLITA
jgi:non-canonical purine NTP pyrophosphatase (RdgB/HAM1 family)